MTEPAAAPSGSAPASDAGGSLDGFTHSQSAPAASPSGQTPQPNRQQPSVNDRSRADSPAMVARQQMAQAATGEINNANQADQAAIAAQAESQIRETYVPESADGYEAKLPADFQLPAGMPPVEFNTDDPLFKQAREAAHSMGLNQAGFSKLLEMYATNKFGEMQALRATRESELAKLGSNAPARVDSVTSWLKAKLGNELGGEMERRLVSAKMVVALEKIIRSTTQVPTGRESQQPQNNIPGYDRMNFVERRLAQLMRRG